MQIMKCYKEELKVVTYVFFPSDSPLGYYMYVEASNGNSFDLAQLESIWLKQAASGCQMKFWYHMYGSGIGSLYVYIKVGTRYNRMMQLSGNKGIFCDV